MVVRKIGDTIVIKKNLPLNHSYFLVNNEMLRYQGCTSTIIGFAKRDIWETESDRIVGYKIDIDNGIYGWEDSMFEDN